VPRVTFRGIPCPLPQFFGFAATYDFVIIRRFTLRSTKVEDEFFPSSSSIND